MTYSDIMISKKAKQYIKDFTENCSNETYLPHSECKAKIYSSWITPEDAVSACMIERKEVINQFKELIESKIKEWHYGDSCEAKYRREMLRDLLEELKKEE